MCIPIVGLGQGFIDAIVEVFVVGEDNVSSDIVELEMSSAIVGCNGECVDVRSPRASHLWKLNHRESRSSRQSATRGRPGVSVSSGRSGQEE